MTNRVNIYIRKRFIHLRKVFGDMCMFPNCKETKDLEFAHLYETELNGRGRGRKERYYDIINNLNKYILLCKEHNKYLDDFLKNNPEELEAVNLIPLIKVERMEDRFE